MLVTPTALLLCGCGDDRDAGPQDALIFEGLDSDLGGELFGEPCVQPVFPEIGICRMGEGACHDEAAGSVCRPFCDAGGQLQCTAREGVEVTTDRGACVCVPP